MRLPARLEPWWAPALAFAATLAVELALVDRKYAIFSGGYGASQVVDRPLEIGLFLLGLLVSQALLIGLFFLIIRALHGKSRDRPVFLFNFLFLTIGIVAASLAAKYEVLSYFSDAISFQLVRNLGGGSLGQALLYVQDEAAQLGIGIAVAAVAYILGRLLVKRFLPAPMTSGGPRWKHLLWLALALPLAVFAADRDPDARYALTRFNAYALADSGLGALTDFDRDGYSWFGARRDTHPFDSTRHPLALDVPGNGVDEDGYGGDFRFAGGLPPQPRVILPAPLKHLVLIVLESTRGDSIGRRVGGREVTPVLNALARHGSYVSEAYSHVGFTSPSLKSLFSGALDPAAGGPSLFRDFKANGYRIGVVSAAPETFGDISEVTGMKANADLFIDAETMRQDRAFASGAISSLAIDGRKLLRRFDEHFTRPADWARPTFLYMNLQEAHFPYHHPDMMRLLPGEPIPRGAIKAANRLWVERTYWNAVAYDDWLIGQVIERLKKAGAWDHTLLAITADHGESLFDDGFLGHGHMINRQQTRIPLILSAPGVKVEGPIGLSDYRAILLRALGAPVPARPPGPVFQHIGPLEAPTEIGMVEKGGVWTVMMLETEQVGFSDSGRSIRYADLPAGSAGRARADRLIDLWAKQRWLAHLARQ
jgi:phosphoglycerol transferase MdoB-like AlkP superfamily enzyme